MPRCIIVISILFSLLTGSFLYAEEKEESFAGFGTYGIYKELSVLKLNVGERRDLDMLESGYMLIERKLVIGEDAAGWFPTMRDGDMVVENSLMVGEGADFFNDKGSVSIQRNLIVGNTIIGSGDSAQEPSGKVQGLNSDFIDGIDGDLIVTGLAWFDKECPQGWKEILTDDGDEDHDLNEESKRGDNITYLCVKFGK